MASFGQLEPRSPSSSCPVDLQTEAVQLCIALQSQLNSPFFNAATELLSCVALPPAAFRRHGRKIIHLIETARDRLEASGISLFLFTSCPKGKYLKDVYFDLLRMLQTRRTDLDVTLQARANCLLIRLSSNFPTRHYVSDSPQIPCPRSFLPATARQVFTKGITTCPPAPQPAIKLITPYSTSSIAMPPPDAFPPSTQKWSRYNRKRPRQYLLLLPTPEAEPPARQRKRARYGTGGEQENQAPGPEPPETYSYKPPRLTKRFGIFCTGKNSMHRRSWSVKAY